MNVGEDTHDVLPEARQHLEQAYIYEEKSEFEKALAKCEIAIQLAPSWAEAHNFRGIILEELNQGEKAIIAYREAARLDPTLDEARENLLEAEAELAKEKSLEAEVASTIEKTKRPGIVTAIRMQEPITTHIEPALDTGPQTSSEIIVSDQRVMIEAGHEHMLKEIRSWAFWLIGIGVISLIASSFLDPAWGILLLLVGLASFFIRDAAMFVIYGVTLVWAALFNAISGFGGQNWGWAGFSLIQIYMAVRVFKNYGLFKQAQTNWETLHTSDQSTPVPSKAARIFPPAGCVLSVLAVLGVVALVVAMTVIFGVFEAAEAPAAFSLGIGLVVDLGVLGLAVSFAALLSRFRLKVLSILGVIGSSIVLLLFLAIALSPG